MLKLGGVATALGEISRQSLYAARYSDGTVKAINGSVNRIEIIGLPGRSLLPLIMPKSDVPSYCAGEIGQYSAPWRR